MDNKINGERFKMDQIPAKLFNSQYLSDITFIIDGKQIFAHSLFLMARSSVFQQQLEPTLGEKKLIPIIDYAYDVFHQFIRFIYIDQIEISNVDWFRLMKLAREYKVLRLVDQLMINSCSEMKKFAVCVLKDYKVGLKTLDNTKFGLECRFDKILRSDKFLSTSSDVLEEILNCNLIKEGITELYIIDSLVRWMNHQCKQNQTQFSYCRQKYNHLIRLIRFPTMSNQELRNIQKKYPDLLTKSDFKDIAIQTIYGAEYDEGTWNSVPRMNFIWPYEVILLYAQDRNTVFTVSTDLILGGFVIGEKVSDGEQKSFTFHCKKDDNSRQICSSIDLGLGALIPVRPKFIYTISWVSSFNAWIRKSSTPLIVNGPPDESVKILEAHSSMLEILFLKPDGSTFD